MPVVACIMILCIGISLSACGRNSTLQDGTYTLARTYVDGTRQESGQWFNMASDWSFIVSGDNLTINMPPQASGIQFRHRINRGYLETRQGNNWVRADGSPAAGFESWQVVNNQIRVLLYIPSGVTLLGVPGPFRWESFFSL